MPLIGSRDLEALPSVWAEARTGAALHNHDRTNVHQVITRSEADAITYNSTGPVRKTTYETPQASWRNVTREPENERFPQYPRQNYSPLAQNQSLYHSYDYLSFNYTISGRGTYSPNLNPVVIDKII